MLRPRSGVIKRWTKVTSAIGYTNLRYVVAWPIQFPIEARVHSLRWEEEYNKLMCSRQTRETSGI